MTKKICSLKIIPRLLGVHMQEENTDHSQLLAWVFFMKIAANFCFCFYRNIVTFDSKHMRNASLLLKALEMLPFNNLVEQTIDELVRDGII